MTDPTSPADFEQDLRVQLAALAATPDVGARAGALDEALARKQHQLTARRRMLVGAAATTAVVAGAGVWRFAERSTADQDHVYAGTTTAPRSVRGIEDWQQIDDAPLSPRTRPTVVWAGDRLVVYGGSALGMSPPTGAAWLSATRSWQPIADGPAGTVPGGFALWDGTEVLVGLLEADSGAPWFDPSSTEENPLYGIAAYDPASDRWRYVTPLSLGFSSGRQAVLAGGALVVAVRSARQAPLPIAQTIVRINTETGAIEPIALGPFAASPYADASGTVDLVTVGNLVVATPNWDRRPWVLDPLSWTWRQLPAPDSSSLHLLPATATGDLAVFQESNGTAASLWVLDPTDKAADPWRRTAPNPEAPARWDYNPVWSGREVFLPGAAYDPTADQWRAVPAPPRGKDRQRNLVSTWADDTLLLFGGEEHSCPDNTQCDRQPGPDTLDGWTLRNP